ncbi:unnamed protein product [Pocillopora meandrina]|uniref:Uncharacterized protein n=1 Tax=Pocillopora meandrina TaxID=46732 RepID=A0AAU9X1A8_9CNID|nr:unnamed protein product [Pocillopora meandrina]
MALALECQGNDKSFYTYCNKKTTYYSRVNGKTEYRNTPQQGNNYLPAQPLMSRRLKDIIPTADHQLTPQVASPSLVYENRRQKTKINASVQQEGLTAPQRVFTRGKCVC